MKNILVIGLLILSIPAFTEEQAIPAKNVNRNLECAKLALQHEIKISGQYNGLTITSFVESANNKSITASHNQILYYFEAIDGADSTKFDGQIAVKFQSSTNIPGTGNTSQLEAENLYCSLTSDLVMRYMPDPKFPSHHTYFISNIGYWVSISNEDKASGKYKDTDLRTGAINGLVVDYSCYNQNGPCKCRRSDQF